MLKFFWDLPGKYKIEDIAIKFYLLSKVLDWLINTQHRGVVRTQSNIYNEDFFLQKYLTAFRC